MRSRIPLLLCLVLVLGVLGIPNGAQSLAVCTPPAQIPIPVIPGADPICIELPEGTGPGPDPCVGQEPGTGQGPGQGHGGGGQPLCLPGPASCVAAGVVVDVSDPIGLTGGVHFQLSRSTAQANSGGRNGFGYGQSDSDAAQHKIDVPPVLGEGVVESGCHAVSQTQADEQGFPIFKYNHAHGQADVAHFHVDLSPYTMPLLGMPLTIRGDVLCEQGSSTNGAPGPLPAPGFAPTTACLPDPDGEPAADPGPTATGANRADIANLIVNGTQIIPSGLTSVPANTAIGIPPPYPGLVADVYLNEQGSISIACFVPPFFVFPGTTFWGDALRVILKNPITGATVASVIVSWVSTTTCDP
jgi:hypothetical protein